MTTHFQGAFRNLFVLSILSLAGISACGLLKKKGADDADAGEDAAVAEVAVDAAPPPAAAPVASNVDDVARFPDEKAIDNVAATIQRITNVREIPAVGKLVATLAKGGTVTEIASRGTAFLVVFDNPKDGKRVMGWVGQEAFTALTVDAGIKVLTCTAPEIALISDLPFCGRTCVNDPDCPAGQACKGHANKFVNAKFGDAVGVCTVFNAPTTLPTRTPTAVTPVPPPPAVIPVPFADTTPPVGGRCPVGFQLVGKDSTCHKICTAAGQCRTGFRCALAGPQCGNVAVCATVATFCR